MLTRLPHCRTKSAPTPPRAERSAVTLAVVLGRPDLTTSTGAELRLSGGAVTRAVALGRLDLTTPTGEELQGNHG